MIAFGNLDLATKLASIIILFEDSSVNGGQQRGELTRLGRGFYTLGSGLGVAGLGGWCGDETAHLVAGWRWYASHSRNIKQKWKD